MSHVKDDRCPYCFGHGWLTNSDGDTWPCDDCTGTGTLTGMWSTHAEALNIRAQEQQ